MICTGAWDYDMYRCMGLWYVQVHGTIICCGREMFSPLYNVVIANKLVILVLTTAR